MDVLSAEDQRIEALVTANYDVLSTFLTDNFFYTHSSGRVEDKVTYLTKLRLRTDLIFTSIKTSDRRVQSYGDISVVSGQIDIVTNIGVHKNLYLGVWHLEDGRWKLTAWTSTPAAKQTTESDVKLS
jgi:hypothetical protein